MSEKNIKRRNVKYDYVRKPKRNQAQFKYTRDVLLGDYTPGSFVPPSALIESMLSESPLPPSLQASAPFAHALGAEVNPRRHPPREGKQEQMPLWVSEDPGDGAKGTPKFDEEFGKIDLKVEKRLKKNKSEKEELPDWDEEFDEEYDFAQETLKIAHKSHMLKPEDLTKKHEEMKAFKDEAEKKEANRKNEEEAVKTTPSEPTPHKAEPISSSQNTTSKPEPVQTEPPKPNQSSDLPRPVEPGPKYELNLLKYHRAIGNPFARTLIDYGAAKEGLVFMVPFTKPFEKIWFYKDSEKKVQGPFSTIEMFNWTIKGFFPEDLEIALGGSFFFIAMNVFNHILPIPGGELFPEMGPPRMPEVKSQQTKPASEAPPATAPKAEATPEPPKQEEQKQAPKLDEQKQAPKLDEQKQIPKKEEQKQILKKEEQKQPPRKEEQKQPPRKEEQKQPSRKEEQKQPLKKEEKKQPSKREEHKQPPEKIPQPPRAPEAQPEQTAQPLSESELKNAEATNALKSMLGIFK